MLVHSNIFFRIFTVVSALFTLTFSCGVAYSNIETQNNTNIQSNKLKKSPENVYVLGPNDYLKILFVGVPEYSGFYTIGPDGTIYLPEIKSIHAEGLTVDELREELVAQFEKYIFNPEIDVLVAGYRVVRIFVKGEVARPGFYTFKGFNNSSQEQMTELNPLEATKSNEIFESLNTFPTIYDSIRSASGITQNANLSEILIKRKNSKSNGGGYIQANIDLLSFILDGNHENNIRLFDGDVVEVQRSDKVLKKQILEANKTNLSPDRIIVFLTGNVIETGPAEVDQGASLVQAISSNGGLKILTGDIEFIRFNDNGTSEKRVFKFNSKAPVNSYKNPILMSGDVINVRRSNFGNASDILQEVGTPIFQGFALWRLFEF